MAKKLYGTDPDQVPTNADLGTMAYQDKDYLNVGEVHSDNQTIVSTNGANAFSVTTNTSSNVALSIGGSNTINGVTSNAQSFYIMNVARDSGSGKSTYFNGNIGFPDGYGIDFSASAGGGATSSVLDDYEEGTWTPVYFGSSTSGTGTYTRQSGVYVKVGDLVYASCSIGISAHTGTGSAEVSGLPYAAINSIGNYAAISLAFNSGHATTSGYQIIGFVQVNTAGIKLWETGGTGQQNALALDTSFSELDFTIVYKAT